MIYSFVDCEVDIVRRELRRSGQAIHVEPQVFDVLVYLIQHRDRVVTKEELLKAVWQNRIVSDATLDSRISAARQAIGDTGRRQSLLRTVARRGFRLVCDVHERTRGEIVTGSTEAAEPASESTSAQTEKPSIAVLPMANVSDDTAQEYFADGVTEDLIAGLSRVRWLRVISRSSSFSYKGKNVEPKQVSRDLGVRYIVAGSVRRSGHRVRIGVELVDASNAIQLWSANYDRELEDIFDVQDQIVQTIVGAVEPEVTVAEWERARQRPLDRLDAWDHYRRGTWHLYRFDRDDIVAARRYCLAATERDPNFAEPYSAFAYACHLMLIFDYAANRDDTLREGLEAARRAVQLDDRDSFGHAILGRLYMSACEYELAITETRTAIERNPHSPQAHFGLGFALVVAGRSREALVPLLKAVELSPRDPNLASYGTVLATAHVMLGQPAQALEWARTATRQPSSHFIAFMHLAVALSDLGDKAAALKAKDRVLDLKPDFTPSYVTRCWPFKRQADTNRLVKSLRKLDLQD
jgi:TolB-like protein/cytochrome c-type biogenesis protein CcmH/NrfG